MPVQQETVPTGSTESIKSITIGNKRDNAWIIDLGRIFILNWSLITYWFDPPELKICDSWNWFKQNITDLFNAN